MVFLFEYHPCRDDIPLEIGAFERKRLVFGLDPTRRGVGITVNWREFNHTRTEKPLRIKYGFVGRHKPEDNFLLCAKLAQNTKQKIGWQLEVRVSPSPKTGEKTDLSLSTAYGEVGSVSSR